MCVVCYVIVVVVDFDDVVIVVVDVGEGDYVFGYCMYWCV